MRAAVFDAQVAGSDQHGDVDLKQSLLSEVLVREAQRPLVGGASWIDTFRAINHAFFLGFSPSYVLVNTTQLGVLLWPELAKKHGFAKSASAIGSVTKVAFNIMRETLAAGARVGPKRALDAVITEDVLRKAEGVDEDTAAFLMKIIADGIIDIGGSSRELGRVADASVSSHLDTGLRWAASFGLYSETFTRLVAALAARKLNGNDSATPPGDRAVDAQLLRLEHSSADGQDGLRRADDEGDDRLHAVQRAGAREALPRVPHRHCRQDLHAGREDGRAALPRRPPDRRHGARRHAGAAVRHCGGDGDREAGRPLRRR
jgi:hypothetical protein